MAEGQVSRHAVGVVFVLLCAILWAGSSVLIQFIFEDLEFRSPILLTYVCTSLLALHCPAYLLAQRRQRSVENPSAHEGVYDKVALVDEEERRIQSDSEESTPRSAVSQRALIKGALVVAPLWFLSNTLYNYSLMMTSVSSSTIISNLSASFTLLFAWQSGLEKLAVSKILGVMICFTGAVLVGLVDDQDGTKDSLIGDIVALLSSAGYGLYTTLIRFFFDDEQETPMQLALGYVGLVNVVGLILPVVIMSLLHSPFLGKVSSEGFGFVALDGIFDTVIADYCWAKAIVYTSPTIATIGTSITIPFALLTDFFVQGVVPTNASIGGAVLVVVGFVLVNVEDETWLELWQKAMTVSERRYSHDLFENET